MQTNGTSSKPTFCLTTKGLKLGEFLPNLREGPRDSCFFFFFNVLMLYLLVSYRQGTYLFATYFLSRLASCSFRSLDAKSLAYDILYLIYLSHLTDLA